MSYVYRNSNCHSASEQQSLHRRFLQHICLSIYSSFVHFPFSLYSLSCHITTILSGPFICTNCHISDITWRHSNTFFLDGLCVGDLLCRDVTDKERGGSKPLSSVMHFPFDSAAATESYFPAFLPLSVLFCVQLWNVLQNSLSPIVKTIYLWSCFFSLFTFFFLFSFLFFFCNSYNLLWKI